jgi:hypothetical protein
MPNAITKSFNRTLIQRVSTVEYISSNNIVDLKADASQQLEVYGVHYGYLFVANIDRLAFQQSYVIAFLDFQRDVNTFSFASAAAPEPQSGDAVFFDSLGNELETFRTVDLAVPLRINGDRRLTFIMPAAELSGVPTEDIFFILEVRGEVTQISQQDKPRLGQWVPR